MKNHQFLIPSYLEKFKCIGSICEDTCCHGWKVALDETTYKKYSKSFSKGSEISIEHIVLNNHDKAANDYGYIKMRTDGNCPYLSDDKLCSIQSHKGEEWLSYTCYSYPRIVNQVNGIYEMSGTPSCPEVARLILLNEEPMEFKDISLTARRDYIASINLENSKAFDEHADLIFYFWPLRIFTITTLQDRRYSLDERLILLGLGLKKVMKLSVNIELSKAVATIESYTNLFNDVKQMKELLSSKRESKELTFSEEFVRNFSSLKGEEFYTASDYLEIVTCIIDALNIKNNQFAEIQDIYIKSYEVYYKPYMGAKEYILENYLVNEVFKEFYPFAKTESMDISYKMLITLYNVVKFHLVGISAYHKKLDDALVVKTIQAFSKAVLHHKNYLKIFVSE